MDKLRRQAREKLMTLSPAMWLDVIVHYLNLMEDIMDLIDKRLREAPDGVIKAIININEEDNDT